MAKSEIQRQREFLQDRLRLTIDFRRTDQNQGVTPPPLQKPPRPDQPVIPLPRPEELNIFAGTDLIEAIGRRRSHRRFQPQSLTLAELALLLWATQGVQEVLAPGTALRTVPSAGCRHAFETYLLITQVEDVAPGLYRYLPVEHALVCERLMDPVQIRFALVPATLNQRFVATAPVTFAWTTLPYRMEWRYDLAAHRVIAIDAGHLCQNLYLACEAIAAGTCAIAAYNQDLMDQLLGVDGEEEFCIYLAPVGKV
ncbi:MAG: SagB/ThcOx family dehydrogenase [Trichloromonadaceae bacterium]